MLEKLEDELYPPLLPTPQLLEQPQITAGDLGRVTGEAVQKAHEATSKSLEELGKAIMQRMEAIDALRVQMVEQLKEIRELADTHRDAGKEMSLKIELATNEMVEARDLIDSMRKKIQGSQGS